MEKKMVYVSMKNHLGKFVDVKKQLTDDPTDEKLIEIGEDVKNIFPKSSKIIVEFQVLNTISGTWMTMKSYYANEKRLVKH